MEKQGRFIVSLTGDKWGNVWVGTEDNGLWKYDRTLQIGKRWKQFTSKNGLGGDSCYSLACDRRGRIWAGTLNNGVSVYNGHEWKTYGAVNGPLGNHIVSIACSPIDGDVWLASELGLTRYSLSEDSWHYYTQSDGLPSNQINSIAFDSDGTLYAGSDCDGIAISSSATQYKNWQIVKGPERIPLEPVGNGLPSNLINCILVSRNQKVYVGTDAGLAISSDHGLNWYFIRGKDWHDKVTGLSEQAAIQGDVAHMPLMSEDYVTCLSEGNDNNVWVCHRSAQTNAITEDGNVTICKDAPTDYVQTALVLKSGEILFGKYGSGVSELRDMSTNTIKVDKYAQSIPQFPRDAQPPRQIDLQRMLKTINRLSKNVTTMCAYIGPDWNTQGDWVGHYGAQYATLCAAQAPLDHNISCWNLAYSINGQIGPHHDKDDALRHWVHWAKTNDPRSLFDPLVGYRRQSEWDDHGEAYSRTFEGPDEWIDVTIPDGTYRVSLYDVNKDGHDGDNRYRDYEIQLKEYNSDLIYASQKPTLAHARIHNFWGGVYLQFLLQGPGRYYFRIAKNYSFNTLCAGVFVDKTVGPANSLDNQPSVWLSTYMYDNGVESSPTVSSKLTLPRTLAIDLWDRLTKLDGSSYKVIAPYRILAYRAGIAQSIPRTTLDHWRHAINLWRESDHKLFLREMDESYNHLVQKYPQLGVDNR